MPKYRKPAAPKTTGYTHCACRDCFEIAIASEADYAMCHACRAEGCELNAECCAVDHDGGE